MNKTLAVLATAATLGVTTMAAPAEAHWRGGHGWVGPGLAFGLAAGALTAGAIAASQPYYGPYYYGPGYYRSGPYAYYGGPFYRHRYWRYHHHW